MGQIDKPCVTGNCSVIPTESVTGGRFSYTGETCAVTQETAIMIFFFKYKNPVVLVSSLNGFSIILGPSSSILGTHLYTVRNQHKADNTQKTGLGHCTRRFPAGKSGEGTVTHWSVWVYF